MTEAYILFCQKENGFGYTTFIQVYTDLDSAKQAGLEAFNVHTDSWRVDDCGYERSQVTGDGDIVWILKQAVDVMPAPGTFTEW